MILLKVRKCKMNSLNRKVFFVKTNRIFGFFIQKMALLKFKRRNSSIGHIFSSQHEILRCVVPISLFKRALRDWRKAFDDGFLIILKIQTSNCNASPDVQNRQDTVSISSEIFDFGDDGQKR